MDTFLQKYQLYPNSAKMYCNGKVLKECDGYSLRIYSCVIHKYLFYILQIGNYFLQNTFQCMLDFNLLCLFEQQGKVSSRRFISLRKIKFQHSGLLLAIADLSDIAIYFLHQ